MGSSPSPLTHSSSRAASAAGEGRKGCLFLEMPFAIQVPSTWFYSAASYTRHQTSPRLLCAGSFPHGESCLDPPCVFQSISPVRHSDKLKQADFDRAQKEACEGSARHGRAASPRSLSFPVEIRKVVAFQLPARGFSPPPAPTSTMPTSWPLARKRKFVTLVAGGEVMGSAQQGSKQGWGLCANVS